MIRLSTADPSFDAAFTGLLNQGRATTESVNEAVASIIGEVRAEGDQALLRLTERLDRQTLTADRLRVSAAEIKTAVAGIGAELTAALDFAATRIERDAACRIPARAHVANLEICRCLRR